MNTNALKLYAASIIANNLVLRQRIPLYSIDPYPNGSFTCEDTGNVQYITDGYRILRINEEVPDIPKATILPSDKVKSIVNLSNSLYHKFYKDCNDGFHMIYSSHEKIENLISILKENISKYGIYSVLKIKSSDGKFDYYLNAQLLSEMIIGLGFINNPNQPFELLFLGETIYDDEYCGIVIKTENAMSSLETMKIDRMVELEKSIEFPNYILNPYKIVEVNF